VSTPRRWDVHQLVMRAPAGAMNAWADELVARTPSAAPDESESDSDLTPINGVAFADAAAWTTRTHAMIHGHNDGSSFKTVAKEIERVCEVELSKTWRKRLKKLFLRQIDLENYVGKALEGAGESDSDSSGDESDTDEEDDAGAGPDFAPAGDAADDDLGVPAADDAGPDIPDAGLDPAPVPATADAPAPAAAPAPAFTLSPRLVDLQLPPAMQKILQQRQQANKHSAKNRLECCDCNTATSRQEPELVCWCPVEVMLNCCQMNTWNIIVHFERGTSSTY